MAYIRGAGKIRRHEGLVYVDANLEKKADAMIASNSKKPIKTWARRSMISPAWIGLNFSVHNGKDFINVYVTDEMIGHRLGEFAPTRTWKGHSSNNKAADAKATDGGSASSATTAAAKK
ncbi:MAG: 30S ribosomal protein S19 [Mycoplasmataceae bacterium]|nr:30S ribosomal protein S19 [Mycoplasmataceae bacterium]